MLSGYSCISNNRLDENLNFVGIIFSSTLLVLFSTIGDSMQPWVTRVWTSARFYRMQHVTFPPIICHCDYIISSSFKEHFRGIHTIGSEGFLTLMKKLCTLLNKSLVIGVSRRYELNSSLMNLKSEQKWLEKLSSLTYKSIHSVISW